VGQYLAQILIEEKQDVCVIEKDEKLASDLDQKLDAKVLHGTGISRHLLHKAGIERAHLLLAVTEIDEVNLVAAMTADKISPECRTVARVRDRRFVDGTDAIKPEEYGIDFLVSPEEAVGAQVVELLKYQGAGEISPLGDGQVSLLDLPVLPHTTLPYLSCGEFAEALPAHARVVALLGDDGLRIARAEDRLDVGQRSFVLAARSEINEVLALAGAGVERIEHVLLIGGGTIGAHVAGALERAFDVTVIEENLQRAEEMAVLLKQAKVLHGDGTDPTLLQEQIREGQEAVVVLPHQDSLSLLTAIMAKQFGAKKVIARVDNSAYAPTARKLGIDALISPRRAMADAIMRFVRRRGTMSTTMLGNHQGELIDIYVESEGRVTGVPIRELKVPKDCLIGMIARGDELIIPQPDNDTRIEPGDHVFIVALRAAVPRVEALFG